MSGLGTRDFNGLWNEKKTFIPHSHNIISIQIHRHSQTNIIVYDKVSDDFIFLSIKGTCPNQNLVAHHQFLDNLPGKAFETHWQFTGILIIYNGRHAKSKYLNIAT